MIYVLKDSLRLLGVNTHSAKNGSQETILEATALEEVEDDSDLDQGCNWGVMRGSQIPCLKVEVTQLLLH